LEKILLSRTNEPMLEQAFGQIQPVLNRSLPPQSQLQLTLRQSQNPDELLEDHPTG
jgi:hypothetical protein